MPTIARPKAKPLYLVLDADVRADLDEFVRSTGRDYKTEITFALREHIARGPRPLPSGITVTRKGRKRRVP